MRPPRRSPRRRAPLAALRSALRPALRPALLLAAATSAPAPARAQPARPAQPAQPAQPSVAARRRTGPLRLDGRLDEPDWARATPAADFRQRDPHEGRPATQRTEVRFLFDDDALYVGARMFDTQGARGVETRLARRDQEPAADYFMVVLDTYHDHAGRTVLRVDPSGVEYDALALGHAAPDPNWNAVWDVATRVDSLGWTAEIRIPFSELRLAASGPQTWGLQLWRYEQRLNETSQWAFWPKRDVGGPTAFGHLTGLAPSRSMLALQALPYLSVGVAPATPGGAVSSGSGAVGGARSRTAPEAGLDLGVSAPGSTGTVTVNPDFGQVEVDPAILNLTALETFFPEKRPFFVQDAGVLSYGAISCFVCGHGDPLQLYYSRRIGHPPSWTPPDRVLAMPGATAITAAARTTTQTRDGWTVGTLVARTASASAQVLDSAGRAESVRLEPAAWYAVSRAERRATSGDGSLGVIGTLVDRGMGAAADDPLAGRFPARALTGGIDVDRWLSRHSYRLSADAALSSVAGDSAALERIQTSSVHYFQRPGRAASAGWFDDRLEPFRRRLDGYAAAARFAKEAGDWTWEAATETVSPGFEANDFGFVPVAGVRSLTATVRRAFNVPTRWYQASDVTVGTEVAHDFDGEATARAYQAVIDVTLPSYETFTLTGRLLPARYDDRLLRGGPTVAIAAGDSEELDAASDVRGAVSESVRLWRAADRSGARDVGLAPRVAVHPTNAVSLELGIRAQGVTVASQYVATVADPTRVAFGGDRYVVASLAQRTLSLELRAAAAMTPTISFDAYLQPFAAAGAYRRFGEYVSPRAMARMVYGRDTGTISRSPADPSTLTVDPDGDGPAPSFGIRDPTGAISSLRGTAVVRWEFRPGSTAILAWTQTRAASSGAGTLSLPQETEALAGARPANALVVKVTYRFAR